MAVASSRSCPPECGERRRPLRGTDSGTPFFLPITVLRRVFRGKFLAGLKRLYQQKRLRCSGPASLLAHPKQFSQLLRRLHRHEWVVYVKPAIGDPSQVLRYLGRYTHRVAISNHRLVSFDGERVTFRWKDYAHGSKQKKMTLTATEFLRRFFLHVLPKGFVRIRYFGFLANRWRTDMLAFARDTSAARCSSWSSGSGPSRKRDASVWPTARTRSRIGDRAKKEGCPKAYMFWGRRVSLPVHYKSRWQDELDAPIATADFCKVTAGARSVMAPGSTSF